MANTYYIGNAFYDYVEKKYTDYVFAKENIWLIVYGNKRCEPKVILVLSALDKNQYESDKLIQRETEMIYYAQQLSERSGIPWIYVSFVADAKELKKVKVICPSLKKNFEELTPQELADVYKGFGLFITEAPSGKTINKQYSNVYQKWQMSIGKGLTGSDIDIMRLEKGNIKSVYELKRSHIKIDFWRPYPADFHNFILLSKLFIQCGIDFYIVYNYRKEDPFLDDISKLKVYSINAKERNFYNLLGIYDLEDFLKMKL